MSTGELQGLYQQVILDHAREKHGYGFAPQAGSGSGLAPKAGSGSGVAPAAGSGSGLAPAAGSGSGVSPDAAPTVAPDASSHQLNPTCGDEITLHLHLEPGTSTVSAVRWEGQGCSISQASASLLSDLAPGIDVPGMRERIDAFRLAMRSKGAIEPDEDLLGDAVVLGGTSRYIARVKCAMLAWVALEDALLKLPATTT